MQTEKTETGKTEEERAELSSEINDIMRGMFMDALLKMPMFIRLRFVYNSIRSERSNHPDMTDKDINWKSINEMLTKGIHKYDFNDFGYIDTEDQLLWITATCMSSPMEDGPWYRGTCKSCGKEFFMFYKEVRFYKERELELPKHCKECRDRRKGKVPVSSSVVKQGTPKPVVHQHAPKPIVAKEPLVTEGTMAEALKKAGLI